jgi:hypothetical protein
MVTTVPSRPGVRKPIPVVIPFDHLRIKGAMMQKANVGHDKPKMDKAVRRGALPCIRRSRSLYKRRVARGAVLMSIERKK